MKTKIAVIVATVVTLAVNLLSNAIPFNNKSTAEISDSFPVYFVPAGYVFSIWGLIYIGLIAYAVYQFKFANQNEEGNIKEINSWFIISCLANSVWIFLWHYEYIIATIFMMILLLVSLIGIYLEIKKKSNKSKKFFWMVKAPFSLYLGWISVAIVANFSSVIFELGFDGGNYAIWWAIGMMALASILAIIMMLKEKDYIYAGVIVWALIGIAVKFSAITNMVWAVDICVLVMGIALLISKKDKQNKQESIN